MFRKDTVLIVGAGASNEVGLPLGSNLIQLASQMLGRDAPHQVRDEKIQEALLQHCNRVGAAGPSYKDFLNAAWRTSNGLRSASSIDTYMDDHRSDPCVAFCGKLAIARAIMLAERQCDALQPTPERPDLNMNYEKIRQTWFAKFFSLLRDGVAKEKIDGLFDHVKIICFNYDRCLEHALVELIKGYYGVPESNAIGIVKRAAIYHPYGTVGPWHDAQQHQRFGIVIDSWNQFIDCANRIRTFTESVESDIAVRMKEAVSNAKQIAFLGFGYNRQNLELLGPNPNTRNTRWMYGTSFEMSGSDREIVTTWLKAFMDPSIEPAHQILRVIGGKCAQLFDEFRLALMT